MLETECLPFRDTGYFSKLICDYLDKHPALDSLYTDFPNLESFARQIEKRQSFSTAQRQLLSNVLQAQYAALKGVSLDKSAVEKNIRLLKESQTFTVTTGHQLNLFTGPLYFIYKIVSVINMAKQLKAKYPRHHFVPVYWMATEDHDFEEINHINHFGGRISWDIPAGGPVGRLATKSIRPVLEELAEVLGSGKRAGYLLSLFEKGYLEQENLAQATRYIVHLLFVDEGLVILDGDEAELKAQMIPYFKKDLFEHLAFEETRKASGFLKEQYTEQVHVREINLFYIEDGLRERIEKHEGEWHVLNTKKTFDRASLEAELQEHPERFSPNVVLRPLFQEVILPNLSYTGGGGELAYWLQLKQMFEAMEVPFPLLHLRNSVLWISKRIYRKMQKLQLAGPEVFKPFHVLSTDYVHQHSKLETDLTGYKERLQEIFNALHVLATQTDNSMEGAVRAQEAKQLKGMENLQKKLIRAEKKRASIQMRQLEEIKQALFPKNSLQERHDNFIAFYEAYGNGFIQQLKEHLNPFAYTFTLFKEGAYDT